MNIHVRDDIEWYTFLSAGNGKRVTYGQICPETPCAVCMRPVGTTATIVNKKIQCAMHHNLTVYGEDIEIGDDIVFGGGITKIYGGTGRSIADTDQCYGCSFPLTMHDVVVMTHDGLQCVFCSSCADHRMVNTNYAAPKKDKRSVPIEKALAVVVVAKVRAKAQMDEARRGVRIMQRVKKLKREAADMGFRLHVAPDEMLSAQEQEYTKHASFLELVDCVIGADSRNTCPVCRVETKTHALGCGHLYCNECAMTLEVCAQCRKPRGDVRRVYL